jgi:outer membrane protein assembly factor BamB
VLTREVVSAASASKQYLIGIDHFKRNNFRTHSARVIYTVSVTGRLNCGTERVHCQGEEVTLRASCVGRKSVKKTKANFAKPVLASTISALVLSTIAAALVASASTRGSGAKNWPQWRGPESQGISTETGLPTEWSDTKNVEWKVAIPGAGHSSPIIWGDKIFLTTSIEGPLADHKPPKHFLPNKEGGEGEEYHHPDWVGSDHSYTLKLLCLDKNTGKTLWVQTAYEGPVYDHRHRRNTYASPTPVTDGHYVYAYFGSEGIYCYDFDGKQIWKASLGGLGTFGMGTGTSPVLYEDLIIFQCDQEFDGIKSFLTALDKRTGKESWRVTRKNQVTWSTPVLVKTAQRSELIVSGTENVISYDPATGKELWHSEGVLGYAIPTPVVGNGLVVLSAGYPQKKTISIKLGGSGDLTGTPNILWKYDKGTAYVPSEILYGDYVYLISDKGILTCLDAKTGEVKYEGGRPPVAATYMASPVAFEDKILITSEDGDTSVIKAGPKFEVIRTNSIGEQVFSSIAISDGRIFIRGDKNLYSIGNGGGK